MNANEINTLSQRYYSEVIRLNDSVVHYTSPMDETRLSELVSYSAYARVIVNNGKTAGFIFAMDQDSPYRNENFQWFRDRYNHFFYIDRIVVCSSCKGQGIGSMLYRDLISFAHERSIPNICCEINLEPPNDDSLFFHKKFGFSQVGKLDHKKEFKVVSMQLLTLGA